MGTAPSARPALLAVPSSGLTHTLWASRRPNLDRFVISRSRDNLTALTLEHYWQIYWASYWNSRSKQFTVPVNPVTGSNVDP